MNVDEHADFFALPATQGRLILESMSVEGCWCLWLDNPRARNAMSIAMMQQLSEYLVTLQQKKARCLVIRGREGHFCAGGDLDDVRTHLMTPTLGRAMCDYMTTVLTAYQSSPMFIVAVVEGAAIGGGAELTTMADLVIADTDASIGFVQARLGVTPGWGGGQRLIQKIGRQKTFQVLALHQRLSSEAAHELGLFDVVTMDVAAEIDKVLYRVGQIPADCFHYLASWIREPQHMEEIDAFENTWAGSEHRNALGMSKEANKPSGSEY